MPKRLDYKFHILHYNRAALWPEIGSCSGNAFILAAGAENKLRAYIKIESLTTQ